MPKIKDNDKKNNKITDNNKSPIRLTHKEIIINNIDNILLLISNDVSYLEISKQLGVAKTILVDTLNLEEYKAKKRTALECAADIRVEKARQYLLDIKADDTNATVKRQCSLWQHELYIAKIKCPEKYELNYKGGSISEQIATIIPQLVLKQVEPVKNDKKNK